MKVIKNLAIIIATICLIACSNTGLSPVSSKVNGPLGKYFEVVERDYKIKDGQLNVELKRVNEGGPTDASWSSEPTFTVELIDEDDNVISSESTSVVSSKEQLESIFSLGVDESTSISFKFNETDGAVKFKVSSKWSEEESAPKEEAQVLTLSGSIGKTMGVMMTLNVDPYGDVTGAYYYKKQGPKALLYLNGTKSGNNVSLNEYNSNGDLTGRYEGRLLGSKFTGNFEAYTGKEYSFDLEKTSDFEAVDLSGIDFSDFTSEIFYGQEPDSYSDSYSDYDDDEEDTDVDDSDIEKMLVSYEKYIDKYISFMKKIDKDDPRALADYGSLLIQAEDLERKLEKCKNSMSTSQMNRYLKITNKLTNAMRQMQ